MLTICLENIIYALKDVRHIAYAETAIKCLLATAYFSEIRLILNISQFLNPSRTFRGIRDVAFNKFCALTFQR